MPDNSSCYGPLLIAFFADLERAGVEYCILRDYEGLPDRVGNDIDFLVQPEDVPSFRDCLMRAAVSNGWELLKNPQRYRFRSYWLFSESAGKILHIDVWDRHQWRGLTWVDNAAFFSSRHKYNNMFYVADRETEIGSFLIKDLVQNGAVREKYYTLIHAGVRDHAAAVQRFLERSVGSRLAARLISNARQADWAALNSSAGDIRRAVLWQNVKRHPLGTVVNLAAFLWGHVGALLNQKNGMIIVLVGPDGSGKSTVSRGLQTSLAELFPACRYYHGQFGILLELKTLKKLFRKKGSVASPALGDDALPSPHAEQMKPYSFVRAMTYVAYYALDFMLGYRIVARFQSLGNMIIFDRYFYDYLIQPPYKRVPRGLLLAIAKLLPRPDLILYLQCSPDAIHQRKPELTPGEIDRQQKTIQQALTALPNCRTVDTTCNPGQAVVQVGEMVRSIMKKRFKI
ncbi:MAG: hypothetical protein GY868_00300 [Deltaproteobacteria bacterium]|nr:hypothetical protein [Deltaproteobacteria bacterium]